ncbi:hypothetical protein LSAT2_017888 [Lamellibrachia satsuma]|nr:hypothetical protein LSAT2_017888 [Lamellibrachia satsuma]
MASVKPLGFLLSTALSFVFLVTMQPTSVVATRGPKKCQFGDISPACRAILPKDCYDTETRLRCCDTCNVFSELLFVADGCEYGDSESDLCRLVIARHCQSAYTSSRCCATCSQFDVAARLQ